MKESKGFSLIELIVVIAIMAVLTGVITISVSTIGGYYARECAENIVSKLNSTKTSTMGKNSVELEIYRDTDEVYYARIIENGDVSNARTERIGKKSVSVQYSMEEDYTNVQSLGSTPVSISFDRSSGEVMLDSNDKCLRKIWVSQGKITREITIYQLTGKVELK